MNEVPDAFCLSGLVFGRVLLTGVWHQRSSGLRTPGVLASVPRINEVAEACKVRDPCMPLCISSSALTSSFRYPASLAAMLPADSHHSSRALI